MAGHTGRPFAEAVHAAFRAEAQIAKRSELHTFAVMPQRWAVERSFAWLEKCRRLWKIASASSTQVVNSFI
jgi:transposase